MGRSIFGILLLLLIFGLLNGVHSGYGFYLLHKYFLTFDCGLTKPYVLFAGVYTGLIAVIFFLAVFVVGYVGNTTCDINLVVSSLIMWVITTIMFVWGSLSYKNICPDYGNDVRTYFLISYWYIFACFIMLVGYFTYTASKVFCSRHDDVVVVTDYRRFNDENDDDSE